MFEAPSLLTQLLVTHHVSPFSEKEAEKIKERLAQEEAEAIEMEDEENKIENTNNEKEVREERYFQVGQQRNLRFLCRKALLFYLFISEVLCYFDHH